MKQQTKQNQEEKNENKIRKKNNAGLEFPFTMELTGGGGGGQCDTAEDKIKPVAFA